MPGAERKIVGFGASIWCQVMAGIQLAGHTVLTVLAIIALIRVYASVVPKDHYGVVAALKTFICTTLAIQMISSLPGSIISSILLFRLNGMNQKRVACLKAWLICCIIGMVWTLIFVIIADTSSKLRLAVSVFAGIVGLGVNAVTIAVIFIHKKDIEAGVFGARGSGKT